MLLDLGAAWTFVSENGINFPWTMHVIGLFSTKIKVERRNGRARISSFQILAPHQHKPTFPIYHPNSWNSYHFPTAKGTVSPMQPSDGMILVIGPRLEGHSVIFLAIQTHLSCRFLLAVDSLGLRRSGSSSQIINQAQDFPEQVPRHRHLSQLERNVAAMSDNLGPRSSPACRATSSSTSAPPPSAKPVSS